jgi:radical SAM superfamily enzyme YgiQ (UPF0313 family)
LGYLEREQFDIDYMDCTLNEDPWRDLEEKIRREKPDVVGISVICTAFIYDGMNAASLIKAANPKTTIIMGGEHPSFMAEETLRDCPAIDYICVGEGEVTLAEFLRAVEKKGDLSKRERDSSTPAIDPLSKTLTRFPCLLTTSPRWITLTWSFLPKGRGDSWSISQGDVFGIARSAQNRLFIKRPGGDGTQN